MGWSSHHPIGLIHYDSQSNPARGNPSSLANSVFRAHRYGPEHSALQGKDLDPNRFANLNRLYA